MKKTYNYIFAALAAALVLVACTKDIVPGKVDTDSTDVTYRTITVSFDTPTKAKLEGTKPEFEKGDVIMLSDGTNMEPCTVDVVDGVAKITTTVVTGNNLSAVYPSKAVTATKPTDIFNNLLIPDEQSGKFSDANICTATGTADNLCFKNYCPILRFYVDESIKVKKLVIVSQDSEIAGKSHKITLDANKIDVNAKYLNHVSGERVCYVAVNSKIKASNLKFISTTDSQEEVERVSPSNIFLEPGVIYNAFIPYSVKVGDQKWGYCNVGAFYPEDPGYYFAWGENKGYKWDAKAGQNGQFQEDRCFDWENYKYNNKDKEFTEQESKDFKEQFCPEGKLALQNDAAQFNWNGNWRMPEEGEFEVLIKKENNPTADETGVVFGDVLKIPYSGKGNNGNLDYWPPFPHGDQLQSSESGYASVWTKNLTTVDYTRAIKFSGKSTKSEITHEISIATLNVDSSELLYLGLPIRPIYDDSMSGDEKKVATVTIDNYSDGGIL